MPSRKLHDWLKSYLKYTENSESPESYHTWVGLGVLAAALQRKVYLKWGHTTVYPNHYIVLVGPSGRARKGEPLTIGKSFVEALNIPVVGEDNSTESIIRDMKNSITNFEMDGKVTFQCAVTCFSEELAVFTGQQNTSMLSYLTAWYDSRDKWTRRTKHQGVDEIDGMCFNLVSATAPDWLPFILSNEAIGGGFTSRVLFIYEERKKKTIANPNLIKIDQTLRDQLEHDLELIHLLRGPMKLTKETQNAYDSWYTSEETLILAGNHRLQGNVFSGYLSRRSTHARKIAMALSAGRRDSRIIDLEDFIQAKEMLEQMENKLPAVFKGVGQAKYVRETETVLDYIRSRGSVSKGEVLSALYRTVDDWSLDQITKTLEGARWIKVSKVPGQDLTYTYSGSKDTLH